MESRESDAAGQPAPDSSDQPAIFSTSRAKATSSTTTGDGTSEQSSMGASSRTPPTTPLSTSATLASQSTGKSKYNRRFDKRFLATSSSNGSGSPTSRKQPSIYSSPKAPEPPAEPWTPLTPPRHLPSSMLQAEAEPDFPRPSYQQVPTPGHTYHANSMGAGQPLLIPWNNIHQPSSYHLPTNLPAPTMPFPTNFQPNPSPPWASSYSTSPAYTVSPAYSSTSTRHGGEASHRFPVGINPSPPVAGPGSHALGTHTVPPSEPWIPSIPERRSDEDSLHDMVDKPPTPQQGGQPPPPLRWSEVKDKIIKRKYCFWHRKR
ncbi:MAG: hypothetical protein Q9227_000416 [Pyrenula ochraceoflavens]